MATIGRPPKYKTPKEMETVIEKHFQRCDKGKLTTCTDKAGRPLLSKETGLPITYLRPIPYTMEGLDLALNFLRPNARSDYKKKNEEFRDVILRAEKRVWENIAHGGMTGEYVAPIARLMLSAHGGYSEKHDVNVAGSVSVSVVDEFKADEIRKKEGDN